MLRIEKTDFAGNNNEARYHVMLDNPDEDYIEILDRPFLLHGPDSYERCLAHEYIHATGHKKRLFRATLYAAFEGDRLAYSLEELVAESGARIVLKALGIAMSNEVWRQSDQYIGYYEAELKYLVPSAYWEECFTEIHEAATRAAKYVLERLGTEFEKFENV